MAKTENAVVPWDAELAKMAAEVASAERPSLSVITFRNGVMKYMDNPIPGNALDVVIIASVFENAMYTGRFNPNEPRAPSCFAISEVEEELEPHEVVTNPQNPVCLGCPMAEWGSDPESPSKKGKKCKQIRRLAIISATDLESPEKIAKAEIAMAKLPVTSVKNWANYVNALASTVKRPPFAVISNIKVEPHPKNQFVVKFAPKANLTEEVAKAIYARRGEALQMISSPYAPEEEKEAPTLSKKM